MRLPRWVISSLIGLIAYVVSNKFLPKKEKFNENSHDEITPKRILIKRLFDNKPLRIAFIAFLCTTGYQYYQYFTQEVAEPLIVSAFSEMCVQEIEGQLEVICDITGVGTEQELNLHTNAMDKVLNAKHFSEEDRIYLLKIKLDGILNADCENTPRLLTIAILFALITICLSTSGRHGISLFIKALVRLYEEGKISRSVFESILRLLIQRAHKSKVPIPVKELENLL